MQEIVVAGSNSAFAEFLHSGGSDLFQANADVVLIPTAAAFTGMTLAVASLFGVVEPFGVAPESLMIDSRAASSEPYFCERITNADVVVVLHGSVLHLHSVIRKSPVADALRVTRCVVAIGECVSVLGDVMIDPRGGAPTLGLGCVSDVAFTQSVSSEQLDRTRELLGDSTLLATVGDDEWLHRNGDTWFQSSGVVVTRGHHEATL